MAIVDFTNPRRDAQWFADKLQALLDMGVDCFKTDFGERIPTDVVWHDGSDPERMHNYYAHLYNRTVFDAAARSTRGAARRSLFARSATVGGQQFPVHWGGDCESTFESMAEIAARRAVARRCPDSASGATTSAGSRARPIPRSSSGGWRSGCCRRTAGCTARRPTGCRGRSTRRRSTYCAKFTRLKLPADAVPVRRPRRRIGTGHADDAADGAGVPGRSGVRLSGPAVHARHRTCWSRR